MADQILNALLYCAASCERKIRAKMVAHTGVCCCTHDGGTKKCSQHVHARTSLPRHTLRWQSAYLRLNLNRQRETQVTRGRW